MIKILKNGTSRSYVKSCDHCDCTFSFQKCDTSHIDDRVSIDKWVTYYYINCPNCGTRFALGDDNALIKLEEGD